MLSLLVAFLTLSIVFSFLCSLWEAVLLSITPSYAEIEHRRGHPIGKKLRNFKTNIDRPLAAILTLNTVAHTVGAIGVGAQATIIWGDVNPLVTGLLVPAVMTIAILIFSEIIPKTIGATYWKELASFTVNSLTVITWLLAPFVWFSQLITGLLKKDTAGSILSRTDFLAMAEIGARDGVFEDSESALITSLLKFRGITAQDVMTPRTVVASADEAETAEDFFEAHQTLRFSRIPIHHDHSKDDVTGYVLKDDILSSIIKENGAVPLKSLQRELMLVPEDFPLPELFDRLLQRREHIAMVVDQFGGMAGIVTMEDIIETLLGLEIVDESDHTVDMQALARKTWERRARVRGLIPEEHATPDSQDDSDDQPTDPRL